MQKVLKTNTKEITSIGNEKLDFSFLKTGDFFSQAYKDVSLSQVLTNELDGALTNLYLRLFVGDEIKAVPMLGKDASSDFFLGETTARWQGSFEGISYLVSLALKDNEWQWHVVVENTSNKAIEYDLIYGQEVGLSTIGGLQSNEAYIAQYVDFKVSKDNNRFYICARQNQEVNGQFPYLQVGVEDASILDGFTTDGFQFFGTEYKETGLPILLSKESFPNEISQYEFSYITLKTKKKEIEAAGKSEIVFHGLALENLPTAIEKAYPVNLITIEETQKKVSKPQLKINISSYLNGTDLTEEEVQKLHSTRFHEERKDGKLLSYFTEEKAHVVLKEKEKEVLRPHGAILVANQNLSPKVKHLATTSYMYGLLNSQIILGNTNLNKFISNQRNHLNYFKTSGQRLYLKTAEGYQLFNLPSCFEMGFNYVIWTYKLPFDTFVIKSFVAADENKLQTEITSTSGKSYEYLLTNQVIMNEKEYATAVGVEEKGQSWRFSSKEGSAMKMGNPDLSYVLKVTEGVAQLKDDHYFYDEETFIENSLVPIELNGAKITYLTWGEETAQEMKESQFLEETKYKFLIIFLYFLKCS